MARESPYYREILSGLLDRFQKDSVNLKEYSEYLGICPETAARLIKSGDLPGKAAGDKRKPVYIIPVRAIALYEVHAAN